VASDVDVLLGLTARSPVRVWPATYVGLDDNGWILCDVANGDATGRVPAQVMTAYRPEIGERVFLLAVSGAFYLVGPAMPKPARGTVTQVSPSAVTLDTDMGPVTATYDAGVTLSASQVVKLLWSEGAHVVGVLAAPPIPPAPPPSPIAAATTHIDVFQPLDAGSFSDGSWRQQQPRAADGVLGAWFYGSKIRDSLLGAPVSRVELWSTLTQRDGAAPNIGLHSHAAKPAGPPTITTATPIPVPERGWVQLPVSFGQYLANTDGGIGLDHGGTNTFRSLADDPMSGALRITSIY
jgi:hypothetical protein